MPISTHILDTALGVPAAEMAVSLWKVESGEWLLLGEATTNAEGRCSDLLLARPEFQTDERFPGLYRIRFETGFYYERIAVRGLYPFVEIAFEVLVGQLHYHIPLLLTANGYTTYRGS